MQYGSFQVHSQQAIPDVIEQKVSQTKLRCPNHRVYWVNIKHTLSIERKELYTARLCIYSQVGVEGPHY